MGFYAEGEISICMNTWMVILLTLLKRCGNIPEKIFWKDTIAVFSLAYLRDTILPQVYSCILISAFIMLH
jgi:hypothetical protein